MAGTFEGEIVLIGEPLATIVALKAFPLIFGTIPRAGGSLVFVNETQKFYQWNSTSTLTADDIDIVLSDHSATGRWLATGEYVKNTVHTTGNETINGDKSFNDNIYGKKTVGAKTVNAGFATQDGLITVRNSSSVPRVELKGDGTPNILRGGIDVENSKITTLADPVAVQDAVNKRYVDTHPGTNITAEKDILTASAGQTVFTLSFVPSSDKSFGAFLNGVGYLELNVHYTLVGNTFTWQDPYGITLNDGDKIIAWYSHIGSGILTSQRISIHPPITSGTYTVNLATDAYKKFTNRNAGSDAGIALPTPASGDDGKWIMAEYYGSGINKFTVSTIDPNKINYNNDPRASVYTYEFSAKLFLLVMDDLKWYVHDIGGNWIFEV